MFSAFANCWKIPELRKRILYTLGIIALARVGASIPCPGVDPAALNEYINKSMNQVGGGVVGLAVMLTGGGLQNVAVFALGIMPYISASIIMTLLGAVVPAIERLRQEGESGRAKIIQYSRYLTVLICIIQSAALAATVQNPDGLGRLFPGFTGTLVTNPGLPFVVMTVITITSGTVLLMWLGEQITERGIGNGSSIIITIGIVDRMPSAFFTAYKLFFPGGGVESQFNIVLAPLLVIMALAVIAGIIAITQAERKIPVQYAQRVVGRKMMMGSQTYYPMRINHVGVMPIIFAQAILLFPQKLFSMLHWSFFQNLGRQLIEGEMLYLISYTVMILAFSYFWVATQFHPVQVADDLKRAGAYVPGIRPGRPTAEFLNNVMTRITLAGAIFLTIIAVIPQLLWRNLHLPYLTASFFGGTSMLITVGVVLDTMRQVESHLIMRHYDGFLRKGKLRGRYR